MEALNSNRVSSGKLVRKFEKRFAERVVIRWGRIEKGLEVRGGLAGESRQLRFLKKFWQKDLSSPHLHYFNLSNLISLLKNNGFDIKTKGSLSTLRLTGLYKDYLYWES